MNTDTGKITFRRNIKDIQDDEIAMKRQLTEKEKDTMKVGRNAPCGCDSGYKFKHCCYKRLPLHKRRIKTG